MDYYLYITTLIFSFPLSLLWIITLIYKAIVNRNQAFNHEWQNSGISVEIKGNHVMLIGIFLILDFSMVIRFFAGNKLYSAFALIALSIVMIGLVIYFYYNHLITTKSLEKEKRSKYLKIRTCSSIVATAFLAALDIVSIICFELCV